MAKIKLSWEAVLRFLGAVIAAALTAFGTTACMGHGPLAAFIRESNLLAVFM
jgi:hypothetical protein